MGVRTKALFLVFILLPQIAAAQVVITEIMYDLPTGSDSGREWIEVQNVGMESIDVTKLRLFENGTNHKITTLGEKMLHSRAYAIIAANPTSFKGDWPNFIGLVFDSAFSLSNTGEMIAINNASTTFDTVSYTSAMGGTEGNTLSREGQSLFSRKPSPGEAASPEKFEKDTPPVPVKKVQASKSLGVVTNAEEDVAEEKEQAQEATISQVAAVTVSDSGDSYRKYIWWGSTLALALSTAGAIVFARRYAKDEWDIVEDN